MNSSYTFRLLLVSFAAGFLVHLVAGLIATLLAAPVIRAGNRMGADWSARMLFALRVLPALTALLVVGGLCVPGYLLFEPELGAEPVGFGCLLSAFAAMSIVVRPLWRTVHAIARSFEFSAACRGAGREVPPSGRAAPVRVVESVRPVVALTGLLRPSIVISRGVLDALTPVQVSAALRHEEAHQESRDNLKRLGLLAAPDLVPFAGGFSRLEREWSRLAEWAADDRAAAGSPSRPLDLAEALVRVARLGGSSSHGVLASSLVEAGSDLPARVERLLNGNVRPDGSGTRGSVLLPVWILSVAAGLMVGILDPRVMRSVHTLLEHLIE